MKHFIVFCFFLVHISGSRISQKKCDYYRSKYQLIAFNDSGEDAAPKEFPFMARIRKDIFNYHNGILVSEDFILSIASIDYPNKKRAILGELEVGKNNAGARPQQFDIIEEFVHNNFSHDDHSFNLRLFRLNQSVEFNDFIRPACLPQSEAMTSQHYIEVGWSQTNVHNNKRLHKVKVDSVSNEACKKEYSFNPTIKYIKGIDNGTVLCAATKKGSRDMCKGFGGAALLNNYYKMPLIEIEGIASFHSACGFGKPHVFIRLSAHLDWIERIVWGDRPYDITTTEASTSKDLEIATEVEEKKTQTEVSTTETQVEITTEMLTTELTVVNDIEAKTVKATTEVITPMGPTTELSATTNDLETVTDAGEIKTRTEVSTETQVESTTEMLISESTVNEFEAETVKTTSEAETLITPLMGPTNTLATMPVKPDITNIGKKSIELNYFLIFAASIVSSMLFNS